MSALGHPRIHLRRTDSTNDRARSLALAGAPHGTLVTAAEQTAGRGRQGRSWSAPSGSSLLMSLLLRQPPRLLPMIAAVALCDVVGTHALIKWPNDIVVAQPQSRAAGGEAVLAKLAGILAEGRPQEGWVVLGIGLNVAVRVEDLAGLDRPAATLGGSAEDLEPTLARLLRAVGERLCEPAEVTLEAWRARDALRGREIAWGSADAASRGVAEGIDGSGRLVVALAEGGRTALDAGEVHLARDAG